jgi:glycosyltransferase involved in cell wall biosynthesis
VDWNWEKIKTEYITTEKSSYRRLAEKYEISLGTLSNRAKNEKWAELKKQHYDKTVTKSVEKIEKSKVDKMTRIIDVADRLLAKIEQAVNELDIQLYKNVEKVKEIEYNNELRPDKPTKEIIHEEEKVFEVHTIIDRKGVQEIAAALKSIKEVQMLKSELDKREQEARIRNLEKQSETNDDKDKKVIVTIAGGDDSWQK